MMSSQHQHTIHHTALLQVTNYILLILDHGNLSSFSLILVQHLTADHSIFFYSLKGHHVLSGTIQHWSEKRLAVFS